MATGVRLLDELVGGIRPGELWTLGGAPWTGVTCLAATIAQAVAREHRVLLVNQHVPTSRPLRYLSAEPQPAHLDLASWMALPAREDPSEFPSGHELVVLDTWDENWGPDRWALTEAGRVQDLRELRDLARANGTALLLTSRRLGSSHWTDDAFADAADGQLSIEWVEGRRSLSAYVRGVGQVEAVALHGGIGDPMRTAAHRVRVPLVRDLPSPRDAAVGRRMGRMASITIIGGHGKIALLAAPLLVQDGHEVTSWIRNPAHANDVAATGATPNVLSVEDADIDAMTEALQGQDIVVWSAGAGGGNPERTMAVDRDAAVRAMDAAAAAGVQRFVMVSYFGASLDHGVPQDNPFFHYAEAKAAADQYLRQSTLDWTILMPSTLTLEPAGGVDVASPDHPIASGQVSRATVAEVIRAVVARPAQDVHAVELRFNDGETEPGDAMATIPRG